MSEPILTAEDKRIWSAWRRVCLAHARTGHFRRRVDRARAEIEGMARQHPDVATSWSSGKDSTALLHLAAVETGASSRAMTIRDDLDYPDQDAYQDRLAAAWGVSLHVLEPERSVVEWLREHASTPDHDTHTRQSEVARWSFYDLADRHTGPLFLGLRAEESRGRRMNRRFRGLRYTKKNGQTISQPLADWSGLDVYAYLFSREVEMHPVYRCVHLMERPDMVRMDGWWPSDHAATGGLVWLRVHYPSLYARILEITGGTVAYA